MAHATAECSTTAAGTASGSSNGAHGHACVVLAGAPNVGKSALFNRLTASYTTVSNYPGTSVEVARGAMRIADAAWDVLDTPGMYSLLPTTEEERVTQRILLNGTADVIVHVADAKNIDRMLPLTLQLAELGRPMVLALNMMDEAERLDVRIDTVLLAARLDMGVVPVVAISGRGIDELRQAIAAAPARGAARLPVYRNGVGHTSDHDGRANEPNGAAEYRAAFERRRKAQELMRGAVRMSVPARRAWVDTLGTLLARPATGLPVLALVLYVGLYKFVGQFGAGTLVDLIEATVFENALNPFLERVFAPLRQDWLRALFVGDYGVLTLGVRYAVAIILPVVGTFFIFFSILEDTGYFPRLALLVDRAFKRIGLSGRAIIPMVLGFACGTMATMVTRTLETRRERVLATLLLALAVPCSAQLGIIIAVLAGAPAALAVWAGVLLGTFLLIGLLTARLLPGAPASFHMELPPLRLPRVGNVLTKTYTRMHWYFREVLPLFLLASVLLWLGDLTGALAGAIALLTPVVQSLGLPGDSAHVFLFGFFRRDYGAAGLFDMSQQGLLSVRQLTVAAVTLTLFVPCVAQFLMMLKERGARTAFGMAAFITPFAFGTGWVLNVVLKAVGW